MEWVETTGKTLDEAKEAALDELGVDEQDAEFEVLSEPKLGLFGRVRSEGRVRARVRPSVPRAKEDRRDRKRRSKTSERSPSEPAVPTSSDPSATPSEVAPTRRSSRTSESAPPEAEGAEPDSSADAVPSPARPARARRGVRTSPPAPAADASDTTSEGAVVPAPGRRNPLRSSADRIAAAVVDAEPSTSASLPDDLEAPRSPRRRSRARTTEPTGSRHTPTGDDGGDATVDVALDEQGRVAEEFLHGLLAGFELQAAIHIVQPDEDTVELNLTGDNLGLLIGSKGATLLAIQDLTRAAVQRRTGAGNGRIHVDVSGYRQQRSEALARFARKVAAEVTASGTRVALEPMSAPDRKVVHDTLTEVEGVETVSEGEDAQRRVVILPAGQ